MLITQEADRLDLSTPMPKVVVGVPQVLKVFSWIFIYKFHKNMGLGPKKSVKTGQGTPSMIENFEKNKHILTTLKNDENVKKSKNREHFIISVLKVGLGKKILFL